MAGLSKLRLRGTPYERGVTHGETFAEEIRHNLETYTDVFEQRGIDADRARERAAEFVPLIEEENSAYVEEMQGVADGSGTSLEEISLLNVRYEVIYDSYTDETDGRGESIESAVDGCTSFAITPEASANGHTYVGQNWDWLPPIETFLMDVRREDQPNFLALTEAGMVGGKFGLNQRGIGFAVNGLASPEDGSNPFRKPTHVSGREIFDAERFDEALRPILETSRPGSRNYLLAHAEGEVIDLETAPETVNYLYPTNGTLTHANHFKDRTRVESELEKQSPHTLVRGNRIRRLLSQRADELNVGTIKDVLRDDFGHPLALCRYADPDLEDGQGDFHTKSSVIMDLTERRMLITDGPPRDAEYQEHVLGESG